MPYVPPKEIGRTPGAYVIRLRGCNDTTVILADNFTDKGMDVIRRLARLSDDLGGGCKPTVHIGREYEVTMQRDDGSTYTYPDFEDERTFTESVQTEDS